jgi:hypothetical protein
MGQTILHLSFPKIPSGRIRALRENQGIIRCDACHAPFACRQGRPPEEHMVCGFVVIGAVPTLPQKNDERS